MGLVGSTLVVLLVIDERQDCLTRCFTCDHQCAESAAALTLSASLLSSLQRELVTARRTTIGRLKTDSYSRVTKKRITRWPRTEKWRTRAL